MKDHNVVPFPSEEDRDRDQLHHAKAQAEDVRTHIEGLVGKLQELAERLRFDPPKQTPQLAYFEETTYSTTSPGSLDVRGAIRGFSQKGEAEEQLLLSGKS